jgi:hypothetical protein
MFLGVALRNTQGTKKRKRDQFVCLFTNSTIPHKPRRVAGVDAGVCAGNWSPLPLTSRRGLWGHADDLAAIEWARRGITFAKEKVSNIGEILSIKQTAMTPMLFRALESDLQ